MGASPVAYSNLVFLTTAYASGRGGAAARVDYSNGAWTVTHLWTTSAWGSVTCQSTWMTPVCRDGYLYGQFGDKSYTNSPLNCIELATGRLMWSANHFGMGGVTLVGTNLLVVTEYGHLVLARADPSAYTELARYRAFQFTTTARGKCWNSAAVSDGRIYLRSTRGGLSVNVASPELPQLRMLPLQWVGPAQLQVAVGTVDGSAIDSNRLAGIQLRATNSMAPPVSSWPVVTNALRLSPDGVARATNAVPAGVGRQFYMTSEPP
jgi:hypothetical protein